MVLFNIKVHILILKLKLNKFKAQKKLIISFYSTPKEILKYTLLEIPSGKVLSN
jgi:hypothetical protein